MMYMYMISDSKNNVKVGITNNPKRRLSAIQTGHPSKLSIEFIEEFECSRNQILKIEKLLHRELGLMYKRNKGEWFIVPKSEFERLKKHITFFRIRYEDDFTIGKHI